MPTPAAPHPHVPMLEHIWAKSPRPGESHGQTLVQHTWNLLSRLADLARLHPDLPQQINVPRLWELLYRAGLLHDWGKAARGFQQMLRGRGPRWPYRHEVLSLAFVPWLAQDLTSHETTLLAAAIATHHKDFPDIADDYLDPWDEEEDPLPDMLNQLDPTDVQGLHRWLQMAATDWIEADIFQSLPIAPFPILPWPEAQHALTISGIRRLLHDIQNLLDAWEDAVYDVGDDLDRLAPVLRPGILLRGLLVQADHTASAETGPLPQPHWDERTFLQQLGIPVTKLYPHQQAARQLTSHGILTAPTGSGKTEAALLWAIRQNPPRIFYTLPYQASMNAMFDRLERLFPSQVGLIHGRSVLALFQRLMDQEDEPRRAAHLARHLRNLAGLAYHPVRVFSPFHMLKATFQLKGFEALLADFTDAAFIFDEIHAYEPRRLGMITATMGFLASYYHARFLVMSATLPSPLQDALHQTLGELPHLRADEAIYRRYRRHRLYLQEGDLLDPDNLARIAQEAQTRQVLVVCNTVARAQQVWQWAETALPDTPRFLLHGRFNMQDRGRKEQAILAAAGLHTTHRQPVLVIATQTVEVSLNLDLDILFTDIAPLEALFQRFGRINRLGRRAPAPVHIFRHIDPAFTRIYQPAEQLDHALDLLDTLISEEGQGFVIDEARLQSWLNAVYTGPVLQKWQELLRQAEDNFRRYFLADLMPMRSNPGISDQFYRLFDGIEVLPISLYDAYQARKEGPAPLTAAELLVPLRWGHYHMLAQQGLILPGEQGTPPIAQTPYDPDLGLQLTT